MAATAERQEAVNRGAARGESAMLLQALQRAVPPPSSERKARLRADACKARPVLTPFRGLSWELGGHGSMASPATPASCWLVPYHGGCKDGELTFPAPWQHRAAQEHSSGQ